MRLPTTAVLLCLLCMGCGGKPAGPERYEISGAVTLDGQPVEAGAISFDAKDGKSGAGAIVGGKYQASVPAGLKTVRINSQKATGQKGPYGEEVSEELIPRKYNSESQETVTINADGKNVFDFKLVSKAK